MKLLLACAFSLVVLCSSGAPNDQPPLPTMGQFCWASSGGCERMQQDAWADTCRITVYVCDGVPAPRLVLLPLADGFNGAYFDGLPVVFINANLSATWYAYSVIAHEMTHYLQNVTGANLTRCERESEAFTITNYVLREHGRSDLRRDDWREGYGCSSDV